MQDAGFLNTRSNKPIGLGIVIGAHVAVLAAIILAPPETFTRITYFPTKLIKVPPEPQPAEPTRRKEATKHEASQTERVVETLARPDFEQIKLPPLPPLPDPGPIGGETINPPKAAEPVFTAARIEPGSTFQPDYPTQLVRAGIEGTATVRVLIGADGRVKAVEMVNATDPAFFDATRRQALRSWRFKPATRDGTPTESWRTMTVRFKLQG